MNAKVYNQEGKEVGSFALPEAVFGLPWNGDLVHQVVTAMQSNARQGTADSKGRGEVRGGGKKPWRQKGTGRSRHGSIRSPIWRGGGVTHGPTSERNYERKINKKMKQKALHTILARKFRDGEIILLDRLHFNGIKTKSARTVLEKLAQVGGMKTLAYRTGNRALVSLAAPDPVAVKSFRNLGSVAINEDRNLNPLDLINYRYVIIPEPAKNLLTTYDHQ